MYYTTSGAYRKSKMLIDYATDCTDGGDYDFIYLNPVCAVTAESYFRSVFLAGAAYQRLILDKAFMNKKGCREYFLQLPQ